MTTHLHRGIRPITSRCDALLPKLLSGELRVPANLKEAVA